MTTTKRGKGPALHPTADNNQYGPPAKRRGVNAQKSLRKFHEQRETAKVLDQIRFPEDEL